MPPTRTHPPEATSPQVQGPVTAVQQGSRAYTRVSAAFFLVGFASFSLIYCVQPLLGAFTLAFHVTPAQSALALSLTTGCLAAAILLMGALGERLNRRNVMFTAMCGAALLTLAAAMAPSWPLLLGARAATGLVLGGVPAIAMAALADVIDARHLGRAMGMYVGGTAFGGMMGRVSVGVLTEFTSWSTALGVLAGVALLAAFGFRLMLPAIAHARPAAAPGLPRRAASRRTCASGPATCGTARSRACS
ncbi:MFS transporter [Deinococcus sonorensis]|uniref:MFS transporter n=2 Tax=Deinococcus sonorensis TaxID=309891 RepID=A0AAU7U629_9DEIO